jgi:hypothetical protein
VKVVLGSALAALLLLSGCGKYTKTDKPAEETGAIGDPALLDGTTTTQPGPGTSADITVGIVDPSSGQPGGSKDPVNRTVIDDPSGLRLTFVIADSLTFSTSDQIVMELTVTNTSNATRYLSGDQASQFAIAVAGAENAVWDDAGCRDHKREPALGPTHVEPGEEVRYQATYPTSDRCRVAAGSYLAAGRVEVCPPETLITTANGQPRCDEERNVIVSSTPLQITITS